MKKELGKWRTLTDLRAVARAIQPMVSIADGIALPSLLPKAWSMIVIDVIHCFSTLPRVRAG